MRFLCGWGDLGDPKMGGVSYVNVSSFKLVYYVYV